MTTDAPDLSTRFSELHKQVAPKLWSWAAVHIGPTLRSALDPEDLLQEVSARAWTNFGDFDPARGSFLAWTLGIARRVLGDSLARLARGTHGGSHWSTGSWSRVPDDATRVTARVARADYLAAFVEWVDGLDQSDRRLVVYRGLEDWSHAEVGELLGVSEATASKRWDRLRERLQGQPELLGLLDDHQG